MKRAAHLLPIAFIGAGAMAQALIHGLLAAGLGEANQIRVTNKADRDRLAGVAATYGVTPCYTKTSALAGARTVILATKPRDAAAALAECRPDLEAATGDRPLFISVAAGLTTPYLEAHLPRETAVIRAMPNTSCSVGASATAVCGGRWAASRQVRAAAALFEAVGYAVIVPEEHMNAVTGLSGSGPAYLYLMLEAMSEAGAALGLDPRVACRLALETIRGAAKTAAATGRTRADLAELRRKVTSPGGTTMAGLAALEEAGFQPAIREAVRRAAERAAQLSGEAPPQRSKDISPSSSRRYQPIRR